MYCFAVVAGFITGEGLGGIVNAVLTVMGVSGAVYGTTFGCCNWSRWAFGSSFRVKYKLGLTLLQSSFHSVFLVSIPSHTRDFMTISVLSFRSYSPSNDSTDLTSCSRYLQPVKPISKTYYVMIPCFEG